MMEALSPSVLATVLFTDIVDSSRLAAELGNEQWAGLLERHHLVVRAQLETFDGRELDTAGDGFLAAFDSPSQAVRCASAVMDALGPLGIDVRIGIHTGECEVVGDKLGGLAVHIGARIASEAQPAEVLLSGTVKDLLVGSGLDFNERGARELKGIPGEWQLYALNRGGQAASQTAIRIQLCGRFTLDVGGTRLEDSLPGRQGRLLFAYLALNRRRPIGRDELIEAVWPFEKPPRVDGSLSALLTKLRRALGENALGGRSAVELRLPGDAWIDCEAATDALHRAEAAATRQAWAEAWGPGRVAQHIAVRTFLPGEDAPWIDERRRRLDDVYIRSLELTAQAGLGIGGSELDTADRAARTLVERAPYRESGYRFLMRVLAERDNLAEGLRVYEELRVLLRDELGTAPSPTTQELHRRLLGAE
jgi:class 3 adenylate cyclase/DNA-binding SARP family transcriptional activator